MTMDERKNPTSMPLLAFVRAKVKRVLALRNVVIEKRMIGGMS